MSPLRNVDPDKKALLERFLVGEALAPDELTLIGQTDYIPEPAMNAEEITAPVPPPPPPSDLIPAHAPTRKDSHTVAVGDKTMKITYAPDEAAQPVTPPLTADQFVSQFPMYKDVVNTPDFRIHARKKGVNLEPLRVDRSTFFADYPMYQKLQGDKDFEQYLAENGIRFKETVAPAHPVTAPNEILAAAQQVAPGETDPVVPSPLQPFHDSTVGKVLAGAGEKVGDFIQGAADITSRIAKGTVEAGKEALADPDVGVLSLPGVIIEGIRKGVIEKAPKQDVIVPTLEALRNPDLMKMTPEELLAAGMAGKGETSVPQMGLEIAKYQEPGLGQGGPVAKKHLFETAPFEAGKKAISKTKEFFSFEKQWKDVFGDDFVNAFSSEFKRVKPDWFAKAKQYTPDEIFNALTGRGEAPEELLNFLKGLNGKEKARAAKSMGIHYDEETGKFTILGKREPSPTPEAAASTPPGGEQASAGTAPPKGTPSEEGDVLFLPAPKPKKPAVPTPESVTIEPETTTIKMSPSFRKSVENFMALFKEGQPGGKIFSEAQHQGGTPDVSAYASSYPKIKGKDFSVLGVDRNGIIHILNKALKGKPLTDRQSAIFQDIVDELRMQRSRMAGAARHEREMQRDQESSQMDEEFSRSMNEGVEETKAPYQPGAKEGFSLPDSEIKKLEEIKKGLPQKGVGDQKAKYESGSSPVFRSKLTQVIEEKMPNAAPVDQVRNILKSGGVKQEEIDWMGIEDFLAGKTKVSKEDLISHLFENEVEIKEVMKGGKAKGGDVEIAESDDRGGWDVFNENGLIKNFRTEAEAKAFVEKKYPKRNEATKFSAHTLPGGENYREMLLTLPGRKEKIKAEVKDFGTTNAPIWTVVGQNNQSLGQYGADRAAADRHAATVNAGNYEDLVDKPFRSSHFAEPNILAHVRFNDRTDADGKKVLFLEELQSDWHQKGRKQGYSNSRRFNSLNSKLKNGGRFTPEEQKEYNELKDIEAFFKTKNGGAPDAPFKKTWQELALKKMLRFASENGYDRLAWTTGEIQAERYDLSKHIRSVDASKTIQGAYAIRAKDHSGKVVLDDVYDKERLPDVVGKDLAEKIVAETPEGPAPGRSYAKTFSGLDLKIGGEGMKGFYDQILPAFLNKYAKKWGAKVGKTNINTGRLRTLEDDTDVIRFPGGEKIPVHSIDITDAMKKSVTTESQPLFDRKAEYQGGLFGGEKEIKAKKEKPKAEQADLFKTEIPTEKIKAESTVPDKGLFEEGGPNAKAKGEEAKKVEGEKLQQRLFEGKDAPKGWGGSNDPVESKENPHIWDAIERNSTLPEGIKAERVRIESQFIENGYLVFKTDKYTLSTSEDVAFLLKNLTDRKQENLLAVYLDANEGIIAVRHLSMGTHNSSLVPFDEIPGAGLRLGADAVWIVHNHPSENPIPSVDDFRVTERTSQILKTAGLKFKGHVVIDGPKYHGYMSPQNVDEALKKWPTFPGLPERLSQWPDDIRNGMQKYIEGLFKGNREKVAPHELTVNAIDERLKKVSGGEPTVFRKGDDVARFIRALTPGIKAIFTDNQMQMNAAYSVSMKLTDPKLVPALIRLASKHAGKRIIIGGSIISNDIPALMEIRKKLEAADIDLEDVMQVNASGWASVKKDEYYVKDSGPLYDSLKKDETLGSSGSKWGKAIDRAIKTLKVIKGIKRSDDLAAFDATISTPVFIGEKHKSFAPLPKRALEMIEESDEILSRMAEKLKPYSELKERQKKNVNRLLIEGSISKTVYDDATLSRMALDRFEIAGYKAVRQAFDAALDEIKQMIVTIHGGTQKLKPIFDEIEQAKRQGYVPFSRFGNWAFGIKDRSTGEMIYYGRAENRFSAASQFVGLSEDFKKEIASGTYQAITPHKIPKPFRDSMLGDIDPFTLSMLAKLAGVDADIADEFLRQTQDFFKAKGFKSHFIRRKDVPGFSEDLERSIADYTVNLSKYIARVKGIKEMKELAVKIDPKSDPRLAEYAKAYIDYLSKPNEEFTRFRSGMFLYYLWGNVKSAAINATQPMVTTLPWLTKYAPAKKVAAELIRAQKDVLSAVRLKNGLPELDMEKLPADVRADAKKALSEGIISEQLIYEFMGLARGKSKIMRGVNPVAQEALRLGGFLFSSAEKNNRLITFIAAHRIHSGSDAAKGKFPTPMAFADDSVQKTQFIYSKANRPKIARGKGSLFFIFRSFTLNYIEMLRRLSKDPKSLALALGILGGFAGALGLPFADDAKDTYEWAYKKITGRTVNLEHQAKKWLNQWMASNRAKEAILHGGSRLTPIDLGGSLSMGDILPTPEVGREENLLPKIIGPPADVVNRIDRGIQNLRRGDKARALESVAPEALRNPLMAARLKKEGLTAGSGRKILTPEEITPFERGAKSLGFQPSKLTRSREKHEFELSLKEGSKEAQAAFLKRLVQAQVAGDAKEMGKVFREIAEYNKGKSLSEQVILTEKMIKQKMSDMIAPDEVNVLKKLPGKARGEYAEGAELYK